MSAQQKWIVFVLICISVDIFYFNDPLLCNITFFVLFFKFVCSIFSTKLTRKEKLSKFRKSMLFLFLTITIVFLGEVMNKKLMEKAQIVYGTTVLLEKKEIKTITYLFHSTDISLNKNSQTNILQLKMSLFNFKKAAYDSINGWTIEPIRD